MKSSIPASSLIAVLFSTLAVVHAQSSDCDPHWVATFGASPIVNSDVFAFAHFDAGQGAGSELYAAFGDSDSGVVRWDGTRWSFLGRAFFDMEVFGLAVFDDGTGAALYAVGEFNAGAGLPNRIARWNGTSWSSLADGLSAPANAMVVFDDGTGPALFVGGAFTSASGTPANRVAKWDGTTWSALGSGMDDVVKTLAVFDDGNGPALYAGGFFTSAGGVPAQHVARWDGSTWSALGAGTNDRVHTLASFDDGSGPALYAGGNFTLAGGASAQHVAKWDGTSWSPLAGGVDERVWTLDAFEGAGSGPVLCVGGDFTSAGGDPANHVASWDGSSWSAFGSGVARPVHALSFFDGAGGIELLAGGDAFGGDPTPGTISSWNGSRWSFLGSGPDRQVDVLGVFDDGGGRALYAGGTFMRVGGASANRIAQWDGSSWSALGDGVTGTEPVDVKALRAFDDGGGPALYVGGDFTQAGSLVNVGRIAKWDGTAWSRLRTGVNGDVSTLEVFDDGGGAALFAGGSFTSAGDGVVANHVAKWDGTNWSALGSGANDVVMSLAEFDDGSGPALFAGGSFTAVGGTPAQRVARWNGSSWSSVGGGLNGLNLDSVQVLQVLDDGSGPALFALGHAPSVQYSLSKWDGVSWTILWSAPQTVRALATFDDGTGSALYAAGFFVAGGASSALAKWNGAGWSPVSNWPIANSVALQVFDGEHDSPALYVGGNFNTSPAGDANLARWQGCLDTTAPVLDCPSSIAKLDSLSGPPGAVVHFAVSATDNLDLTPTVVCVPPSGSVFPRGTTIVHCTATDDAGNQSTADFPVVVQLEVRSRGR